MNKKREYPQCSQSDCFGNSLNKCKVLNNTNFRGGCPFYKHKDTVDLRQIEESIRRYKELHEGDK